MARSRLIRGFWVWMIALAGIAGADTPVERFGALKVVGNRIHGKDNTPIQLRGMSLFWSQWESEWYDPQVVNWLANDWGITVIRAAMGIESDNNIPGYLGDPENNKQLVKIVVEAAIARGIYVIIDWHDHNATAHQSQAISFFTEMAQTYGNYPNVIYEIFNEPDNESWSQVKSYATAVINAIRAKDPDNLILVGTPNWSQNVDEAANDKLSGTNIAYVLHFYAASHRDELRTRATTALNKGVALFVSEWGMSQYTGDGGIDANSSQQWMSFMDQNKLSWCNWSIADKNESSAALKFGASTNGGWTEANLTESGKWVRNKLRSYFLSENWTIPSSAVSSSSRAASSSSWSGSAERYPVPGRVEAENYASQTGVRVEICRDTGGGYNLASINEGDQVVYRLRVNNAGIYSVNVRVSSNYAQGGTIIFRNGVGGTVLGNIAVPSTGGWQNWINRTASLNLPAGDISLVMEFQGSGSGILNINWMEFTATTPILRLHARGPQWSLFQTNTGYRLEADVSRLLDILVVDASGMTVHRSRRASGKIAEDILLPGRGMYYLRITSDRTRHFERLVYMPR